MISILTSSYRKLCREFIESSRVQPLMYFRNLTELESQLHGHGIAFVQLKLIEGFSETFNEAFGRWLVKFHNGAASSGWAVALEKLAGAESNDPVGLFYDLAREFFSSWCRSSEPSGSVTPR